MSRNITVRIEEAVTATASVGSVVVTGMDAILEKAIRPLESILLQMVVEFGEKTTEGQRIEVVTLPWFKIIQHIVKDPAAIFQISPRKWEEIIAGAYKEAGFEEVTLTPRSGDHGRDVIAVKRAIASVRVIDQVKAYGPRYRVTADDVRALLGVMHVDPASKGVLTTTSDFAPKLPEDPLIRPLIPSKLELVNGEMLIRRLKELTDKYKGG